MARLPQPGGDSGNWGTILNDYLSQTHKSDGSLKDSSVTANILASNSVTSSAIASNAITTAHLAPDAIDGTKIEDGAISEVLLDSSLQTKVNTTTADATSTTAGKVRLAGDLGGTSLTPTVPGLANKVSKNELVLNVKDFYNGATGTGADKVAIDAVIAYAASSGTKRIYFPKGNYRYDGFLNITTRGLTLFGDRHDDAGTVGGTSLNFYIPSTGGGINLGSDDGQPYEGNSYNGIQSLTISDMRIITVANGCATPSLIANGGTYCAGSYGLADWRGGDVRLNRVFMSGFEYGFHGVQSDVNTWNDVLIRYCKVGMYIGPRSDQFDVFKSYFYYNNTDIIIDGATGVTFYSSVHVVSGSTATSPVRIVGSHNKKTDAIRFVNPWFERFVGSGGLDAFIDIGPVDSDATVGDVEIVNPEIGTPRAVDNAGAHTKYFAKVGNARSVRVLRPTGKDGLPNLDNLIAFQGNTSPSVHLEASGTYWQYIYQYVNLGTGSPTFHYERNTSSTEASVLQPGMRISSQLAVVKATADSTAVFELWRGPSTRAAYMNSSGNFYSTLGTAFSGSLGTVSSTVEVRPQSTGRGIKIIPASGGVLPALEVRDTGDSTTIAAIYPNGVIRTGSSVTTSRPSASTYGVGAQWFDSTLNKPVYSDGTNWRDASGVIV